MTQKELADQLNVTDKAVSKWERSAACPDTQIIPRLAGILGISVEELLNAKPVPMSGHKGEKFRFNIILRAIAVAMGIAVTVLAILDELPAKTGYVMLGIGLACIGIDLLMRGD
jgi:transcriptional regulator with XRE-family HTH domain